MFSKSIGSQQQKTPRFRATLDRLDILRWRRALVLSIYIGTLDSRWYWQTWTLEIWIPGELERMLGYVNMDVCYLYVLYAYHYISIVCRPTSMNRF